MLKIPALTGFNISVLLTTGLVLVGCASAQGMGTPPPTPPFVAAVSWTLDGATTHSTFPIAFSATGQTATIQLASNSPNTLPYAVSAGDCVTVPSTTLNSNVLQITSAHSGSCQVTVQGMGARVTAIAVTVP